MERVISGGHADRYWTHSPWWCPFFQNFIKFSIWYLGTKSQGVSKILLNIFSSVGIGYQIGGKLYRGHLIQLILMQKNQDKLHFLEKYQPNRKMLHKNGCCIIKYSPSQNFYSNYLPNLCVPKEQVVQPQPYRKDETNTLDNLLKTPPKGSSQIFKIIKKHQWDGWACGLTFLAKQDWMNTHIYLTFRYHAIFFI